jgi:predicted nucleic acid-binding protein
MIFVDTGAWLGWYDRRDQHHKLAAEIWREIEVHEEPCVTSNFVLDELFTLLGRRIGDRSAARRAGAIYRSTLLTILRPDEDDEMKALAYFEKFADQEVSFTDGVSFALMRRHRLRRAFTFDRDFALAGFDVVPGEVSSSGWIAEGPPAAPPAAGEE